MTEEIAKILYKWHNTPGYELSVVKFLSIKQNLNWNFSNIEIIHVVGTNGKGSCCNYLNNVLTQNKKVGLFTSPHLIEHTERIKINSKNISEKNFENIVFKNLDIIESYNLNFFEIYTLVAIIYFLENNVDFIILEAGIGAKYDTTNFVQSQYFILTSIGKDHTETLGNSLYKIGYQKISGVKKTNKHCIANISSKKLFLYLKMFCLFKGKSLENINDQISNIKITNNKLYFILNNKEWHLNTLAVYQATNAALSIKTLQKIGYKDDFIQNNLSKHFWSGRFEEICPNTFIDAAHNLQGIKSFLDTLKELNISSADSSIVFSCMKDKNPNVLLEEFKKSGYKNIYVTQMNNERSLKISDINESLYIKKIDDFEKNLDLKTFKTKYVFFVGSIYFIGIIKNMFKSSK